MTPTQRPTTFDWDTLTPEQHVALLDLIGSDGHTIYSASSLLEILGPDFRSLIEHFATLIESDADDPKYIIYDNQTGRALLHLHGVYGLTVLYSLASHHQITSTALGRGFAAKELTAKLYAALTPKSARTAPTTVS